MVLVDQSQNGKNFVSSAFHCCTCYVSIDNKISQSTTYSGEVVTRYLQLLVDVIIVYTSSTFGIHVHVHWNQHPPTSATVH